MAKPKKSRALIAAAGGAVPEPWTWWSVTVDGTTGLLALAYLDEDRPEDDQLMLHVQQIVEGKPTTREVHPSTVTAATPMALVDQDWTTRAREHATHMVDGQYRLRAIDPAVHLVIDQLTTLASRVESGEVTMTDNADPDLDPATTLTHVLTGLEAVDAALQPTKDGIVWR